MRSSTRTAARLTAVAATAVLLVTGCQSGSDAKDSKGSKDSQGSAGQEVFAGLSGEQIADKAVKATTDAESLRFKGTMPDEETGKTMAMDIAMDKKGACAGTISPEGEGTMEIISTEKTLYMKLDEKALRAQNKDQDAATLDAMVDMIGGKWAKTSADGAGDVAEMCNLDTILGELKTASTAGSKRGKETELAGTPAFTVTAKEGKGSTTLYVATEGKPYLLQVDTTESGAPVSLKFSDYGKPVPSAAPKGEIVDLDNL
ncbi:hypothetical protein [Streptomyces sp. NPDC056600]|uniref:hypothetical protein n=1 Tax=Streptomyces sp. NPDC056600 TaxID=3345874 RepID=UPI0036CC3B69